MHALDAKPASRAAIGELKRGVTAARARTAAAPRPVTDLGPEAAARAYLNHALASNAVRSFNRPVVGNAESDFKSLGADASPLTGTTIVKFRQTLQQVPVYGSFVTVELDENNACLGINSSMGTPEGVDPVAKVSPARALEVAAKTAGTAARNVKTTPRLYYYYDQRKASWRLVYIVESVPHAKRKATKGRDAPLKDIVVDARSGALVAALPRTPTTASARVTAPDGLGRRRNFLVEKTPKGTTLRDVALNIATHAFEFRDPSRQSRLLPGRLISNPPDWTPAAVAAHANAAEVAHFLRDVVRRDNIDDAGGAMISSIDCWDRSEGRKPPKQWLNAFWDGNQMVYGQVLQRGGSFYSIANMLDIVGHEMFHGVTDKTSRLEYVTQSGALNESYSDIFGVIIGNWGKPIARWSWKLGIGFWGPGSILRDLQDPTRHDQPKHMRNYRRSRPPYTYERNDYGWVHDNSGIHNYAAYRIISAKSGSRSLFTPTQIAALFFVALTEQLSRTSQFTDSRRAVVQTARTLFRNESPAKRAAKIAAVEAGFSAAGIA